MSEDEPKIRLHRYERILAVKWPGDEHWLMIWPDPYPDLAPPGKPAAQAGWSRLARDCTDDMDGHDWIDPAADHHRDLTRLTAAIRTELDSAARTIKRHARHDRQAPLQRLTPRELARAGGRSRLPLAEVRAERNVAMAADHPAGLAAVVTGRKVLPAPGALGLLAVTG